MKVLIVVQIYGKVCNYNITWFRRTDGRTSERASEQRVCFLRRNLFSKNGLSFQSMQGSSNTFLAVVKSFSLSLKTLVRLVVVFPKRRLSRQMEEEVNNLTDSKSEQE